MSEADQHLGENRVTDETAVGERQLHTDYAQPPTAWVVHADYIEPPTVEPPVYRLASRSIKSSQTQDFSPGSYWSNNKSEKTQGSTVTSGGDVDCFDNAQELKEKAKLCAYKEEYDVKQFYKTDGFAQAIARRSEFEMVTIVAIALNAIWIWIDADYNSKDVMTEADWGFQFVEQSFCVFFTSELLVRFLSFEKKLNCLRDSWFVFDSILVALMVFETWVMSFVLLFVAADSANGIGNASVLRLFRLMRLTRITRMARLFQFLPELLPLTKGLMASTRSVFLTMVLLCFAIYVFAIVCRQLSEDTSMGRHYFPTVSASIGTLTIEAALLDNVSKTMKAILAESSWCAVAFSAAIFFCNLTLINMLIGVLCEVVSSTSKREKEDMAIKFVKNAVTSILRDKGFDDNNDGKIDYLEFEAFIQFPDTIAALNEVGVDVESLIDYAGFFFQSDDEGDEFGASLDYEEFMDLVLQLRADKVVTMKDLSDLRKFIVAQNNRRNQHFAHLEESFQKMSQLEQDLNEGLQDIEAEVDALLPPALIKEVNLRHAASLKSEGSDEFVENRCSLSQMSCGSANTAHGFFGRPTDELKEMAKAVGTKKHYDVNELYHTSGWAQKLARSPTFEVLTTLAIAGNAIWIWIDADYNHADVLTEADWGFQLGEQFFCCFFVFEWSTRFMAFQNKKNCLTDPWFVFDSILVALMVFETWMMTIILLFVEDVSSSGLGNASILRLLRLMRLTRVSRMARLLRAVPELLFMVKGIIAAARSVLITMLLLTFVIYVLAIICRQMADGTDMGEKLFATVLMSMGTLVVEAAFLDNPSYTMKLILEESPWCAVAYGFAIFLSALTLINMMLGVLVEVVASTARKEKEEMTVNFARSTVTLILSTTGLDENDDGRINRDEFDKLITYPPAVETMKNAGIDVESLIDYRDIIFQSDREGNEFDKNLTFDEFMDFILQVRSTNVASKKDMSDLRKFVISQNNKRDQALEDAKAFLTLLEAARKGLDHHMQQMDEDIEAVLQAFGVDLARRHSLRGSTSSMKVPSMKGTGSITGSTFSVVGSTK